MKALIFLLLLSTASYSQVIYKMDMNIQEVSFNKVRSCDNGLEVIWGFNNDTICFLFKEKVRCFYPLTKKALNSLGQEKSTLMYRTIERYDGYKDKHFLLQDRFGEIHIVRIVSKADEGKFIIFITNVSFGYPNYVLGFNCNQCK